MKLINQYILYRSSSLTNTCFLHCVEKRLLYWLTITDTCCVVSNANRKQILQRLTKQHPLSVKNYYKQNLFPYVTRTLLWLHFVMVSNGVQQNQSVVGFVCETWVSNSYLASICWRQFFMLWSFTPRLPNQRRLDRTCG